MMHALRTTTTDTPHAGLARRPGLDVSLTLRSATHREDADVLRVRVAGARAPFRVYLYVDGELREAWIPAAETNDLAWRMPARSRHAVTARAIDAVGRWGGASIVTP